MTPLAVERPLATALAPWPGRRALDPVGLWLCLFAATAHGGPSPPVRFLVDLGDERSPVVVADVGAEFRPALADGAPLRHYQAEAVVPPSRELFVPVPTDGPAGEEPSAQAAVLVAGRLRVEPLPRPAAGSGAVRFSFPADEIGEPARYAVVFTWPPRPGPHVHTLGPVDVPAGAALDLGFAFVPHSCRDQPPAALGVDAIVGRRARPLFRRRLGPGTPCDRWTDVSLPLAPLAGQTVSFRFRAAARGADHTRPVQVLWSDPAIVTRSPGGPSFRPNVILVSLDTLGARHVGAYGYHRPTTPVLDRLATQGALFERALSHYPSTAGSHMTLLTGLLPPAHAVRGLLDALPESVSTLAELLRRGGYVTAAFTEAGTLLAAMGFTRGFRSYREQRAAFGATPGFGDDTFARAAGWLRARPPEPFFLFVHTYQVHSPYDPPPGYVGLVQATGERPDIRLAYDGEVRYVDTLLGTFLASEPALVARSVVLVVADHGEAFGEHGVAAHGTMLYDEVMRVPLVLRGPGIPPRTRVAAPVGLVDVLPTILELAGLPPPPRLHGRSLLPFLRGERPADRPVIAEVRGLPGNPRAPHDLRAVWLAGRKAIYEPPRGRWQVFDLRSDPLEILDLTSAPGPGQRATAERTIAKARRLLGWYDGLAPAVRAAPAPLPLPGADALERLRALGYAR